MSIDPRILIDLALSSGADEAEVYQSKSLSYPVFFEANRLKQLESSQSEGTALRLWRQGRPGLAVAYGEVNSGDLVDKALALSSLNEVEEIEFSPPREAIYPDTGTFIPVESLIRSGRSAIEQVRSVYPEVICSGEWECEQDTTTLANSRGLYCHYTDTASSYYLGIEWVRGEDFLGVYDGETDNNELSPQKLIPQLLQRLKWAESNAEPPRGKVPILFTPNAATMFWGTVITALNGKQILDNSSPWSAKKGELVISDKLTLSQDPTQEPYTCPFDDEGTPTQLLSLIEKGRIKEFYGDRATAKRLHIPVTGNGFRPGLGAYPTPDLVNLIITPGEGSFASLISSLEDGLIVDQMLGGGADISGEFSVNIDLGYRVKKGEIIGRVKDTMVSGNVYTALKNVLALGNDSRWNGSCLTPSVIVESLSVTG
ncbi:MAG: hypothetical protein N5P05_003140 [Chroococcopsis gigantea SAG 12.99]|jgi:PmbA protein|nr:TldD/PmbA family protein [Chlorogloea purpurea SAG 13.99]MDV3001534.1 hypothetical protein [Chroococcopsis gigantea SAG 12.99]